MNDEQKRRDPGDPFREGVRAITGILGALKDAIEETFDDLRQQGDLSPEKAREAARSTMRKAQDAVDDVRDRLDFVSRREFDALRVEVAELKARLDAASPPAAGNASDSAAGAGGSGFPVDGA
jgi:polyhydroxyalkanoate synthesis regulator phasin